MKRAVGDRRTIINCLNSLSQKKITAASDAGGYFRDQISSMEALRQGKVKYDFVEMMACPGGCSGGGGQPIYDGKELSGLRGGELYNIDSSLPVRFSHENPAVKMTYEEYLDHPLSQRAHELLHTDENSWDLVPPDRDKRDVEEYYSIKVL